MDLEIVLIIFIVLAGLASLYSFTIITIDLIAEIKQKNAEKKKAEENATCTSAFFYDNND